MDFTVVLLLPTRESSPTVSASKNARRNAAFSSFVGVSIDHAGNRSDASVGVAEAGSNEFKSPCLSTLLREVAKASARRRPSAHVLKKLPETGSRNPRPIGAFAAGPY